LQTILLIIHILICLSVILIVLVQSGKGGGMGGIFGGGGGDALFSAPSGSQFMRRVTAGFATAFFLTCILMTYIAARQGLRTVTRGPFTQRGAGGPLPGTIPPLALPPAPIAGEANAPVLGGPPQNAAESDKATP